MIGDAVQEIAEIGFGIEAVELGGFDEGIDRGGALAAGIRSGEEIVLATEGNGTKRSLGGVVIWHVIRDVLVLAALPPLSWYGSEHQDRGVGSTEGGQAELTMSCELALLSGRPCDLPGCAVSADP